MPKNVKMSNVGAFPGKQAHCVSRFLNAKGIPTALHPGESRWKTVFILKRDERRADKALSKRRKGDCGRIREK